MKLMQEETTLGTIHVLPNQDFGFSDPLLFVIMFCTERNQKLPFSDFPNKQTKLRLLL